VLDLGDAAFQRRPMQAPGPVLKQSPAQQPIRSPEPKQSPAPPSPHHLPHHSVNQLRSPVFAAAKLRFEFVAESHQVIDLGEDSPVAVRKRIRTSLPRRSATMYASHVATSCLQRLDDTGMDVLVGE
jgi:hypothetical protein